MTESDPWPEIPYEAWRHTKDTLHMCTQVIGKLGLALFPPEPHWAPVALYVTARGLTTGPVPFEDRLFQVDRWALEGRGRDEDPASNCTWRLTAPDWGPGASGYRRNLASSPRPGAIPYSAPRSITPRPAPSLKSSTCARARTPGANAPVAAPGNPGGTLRGT